MATEKYIVKSKLASYEIPNISVGEYFKQNIKKIINANKEKIAFIDSKNGSQVTYKELHDTTMRIASAILAQLDDADANQPELSMFFGDNSLPYITLIMAMAYLGIAVTPAAPANDLYEIVQQLSDSNAQILCVSQSRLPVIEKIMNSAEHCHLMARLRMLIVIDSDHIPEVILTHHSAPKRIATYRQLQVTGQQCKQLEKIPHYAVNPQTDRYVIVYTSGSTGLPKGAVHTHRSFIACILAMQSSKIFRDNFSAIVSFIYPFGHISGTILLANCFASQMTSVIFERPDKSAILSAVQQYRITFLIMFLALSADLVAYDYTKQYDLRSLRVMFFSGTKVPDNVSKGLIERYNVGIHELYGSTELMGGVSTMADQYMPGNVGEPMPNVEMKIVHLASGESLSPLEEGEICFRAPNCFVGYLNNEKATKETIDQLGWYHTGDVGYYDQNGCLFITDRIKELIKYKHWSVSPAEIEAFLQTHQAISGACVVGVPHAIEGAHLRAYVQLESGKSATELEIVKYVQDNMGYQKRLNAGVQLVPLIPRTIIGKIDRQHFKNLVKHEILTDQANVI